MKEQEIYLENKKEEEQDKKLSPLRIISET